MNAAVNLSTLFFLSKKFVSYDISPIFNQTIHTVDLRSIFVLPFQYQTVYGCMGIEEEINTSTQK